MPSITFDRFDIGLDRRKGSSVSDANRLRELKNAYVTTGKAIRSRPGLVYVTTLEAGTVGLVSGAGKLNTFFKYGAGITHADTRFLAHALVHTTGPAAGYASGDLMKIEYAEMFSGYLYVSATYNNGLTFHYYLSTEVNINRVTDAACPNSKACLKIASKMFAISDTDDIVKYSETEDPTIWTAGPGNDAGFLPTGLRSRGSAKPTALGQYQDKMVVFMSDAAQLWTVDPNSALMSLYKAIEGVGTTKKDSVRQFSSDIVFKAKSGFRSITQQAYTENLNEIDIGSAIDELVEKHANDSGPVAEYSPGTGQLWQVFTMEAESTAFVYTYSKEMKISAWSEYTFDISIDAIATLDGDTYIRSGDDVYIVSKEVATDGGQPFDVVMEMPFLDFKAPGMSKYISAMDVVVDGTVGVQFRFDPNDETKITDPIYVTGNSRSRQRIPIEATISSIAPVFISDSGQPIQIDAISFYYDVLNA